MGLRWLMNDFICKELYAPYIIDRDSDYYDSLQNKFNIVLKQAKKAGADDESIAIIKRYSRKILESMRAYYNADLSKSSTIIRNLIKDLGDDPFAVDALSSSDAFFGSKDVELQLFRCRTGRFPTDFKAKDMLYLPESMRSKSGNYRFSIPGNPSLYLSNSSYGCWIETGYPTDNEFNVSPVILDGTQKILNLVVAVRDFHLLHEFDDERVHCWLKLFMLSIATSFRIKEERRIFKSEYIISQAIMMGCKKLGYDGVAYYSKRVSDEFFSICAINLALFVSYNKGDAGLAKHIKIDDAYNYALFKKLMSNLKHKEYKLRSTRTGLTNYIGSYDRKYNYCETGFYEFDKFMFAEWSDKTTDKKKDLIPWGVDTK